MGATPPPHCVTFCEAIRAGASEESSSQLGSGLWERDHFPALGTLLTAAVGETVEVGSIFRFGLGVDDPAARDLTSALAAILGDPEFSFADYVLTGGASDGLASVMHHCASQGLSVLLPLPCYFGYELAALRAGVPVAGYYETSGPIVHWYDAACPVCVVVNSPDALTGETWSLEQIQSLTTHIGDRLRLEVYDAICAMQGYARDAVTQARVRDLWTLRRSVPTAILLGVTKDLGLAGARAGLLASTDVELVDFVRQLTMARAFSAGVIVGGVMRFYCRLLLALDDADRLSSTSRSEPREVSFGDGCPGLTREVLDDFLAFRRSLDRDLDSALQRLDDEFAPDLVPWAPRERHAGYSVMVAVRGGVHGPKAVAEASRELLVRHNLRINPTYMFGGTPEAWDALHRGALYLRINLSTSWPSLSQQTRTALAACAAPKVA